MEIVSYSEIYKEEVIALILEIQQNEFGIEITQQDQPDLGNIESCYKKGNGNFWIARVEENLAGTVALLDIGNNNAALRKMFVKKQFRGSGYGVGQSLLNTLLQWAGEKGFKKILLGTTEKFIAAQRFYEKNGFREIDEKLLPAAFPVMKVDVKFYEYMI